MPWPMIHFWIAYRMFDEHPPQAFLLGSIAPDAVQVREDDKNSKAKSHLHDIRGTHPDWSGLFDFYNARISAYKTKEYKFFLLGYLSHIIADDLWVQYKHELSRSDKSVLKTIWNEENQYDFNLKRTFTWGNMVEYQVTSAPLYEIDGIYTLDELEKWRRQLFIWLQTPHNEPGIENQYLKESNVGAFIEETTARISEWIKIKLGE
jgi:hypothetical protein